MPGRAHAPVFLLATALAFTLGYLTGSASDASPARNPDGRTGMLLAEVQGLRAEVRSLAAADLQAGPTFPAATERPTSARTPDLTDWLQRLEDAVTRFEEGVEESMVHLPADPAALVHRATDGQLPRRDAALLALVDEYQRVQNSDDQDWDRFEAGYRFLRMEDALTRYGRPDDITITGAGMDWEYQELHRLADGTVERWYVDLEFVQGMLMDVSCWTVSE